MGHWFEPSTGRYMQSVAELADAPDLEIWRLTAWGSTGKCPSPALEKLAGKPVGRASDL